MVQKKPKSLRILKSNKSASTSPVFYFLGGLVVGAICSTLFYFCFLPLMTAKDVTCTQAVNVSASVIHEPNTKSQNQNTNVDNSNSAEAEVITQQPKEAELSKVFTHAPPAKTPQQNVKANASTVKANVEPKAEASPFFDQMFKGNTANKPNEKEPKPTKTASEVKPTAQKTPPQKAPFEGLK